jgi:hypothetical protein
MADYTKMTDDDFDSILESLVKEMTAQEILYNISGCYELIREHLNNDVLDKWAKLHPKLAYPKKMRINNNEPTTN